LRSPNRRAPGWSRTFFGMPPVAFDVLSEERLRNVVDVLVRLVEAAGAVVIFVGAVIAIVLFLRALPR